MAVGGVNTFRLGAGTVAAGASVPEAGFMGALTTGTLATFTGFSLDYTLEGSSQLFGQFDHLEGQKVLDSYIEPTESYLVETEKKVFLDAMLGMMWYGTSNVAKKVVQTAPVQKVVAKVVEKVEQQPWGAMRHGAPGERPGSGVGVKAKAVPAKNMVQSKGKDGSVDASYVDHANKGLYNSHDVKAALESRYPGKVSSSTVPALNQKNVKLSRPENAHKAAEEFKKTDVAFDLKGFPIFDKHVKYDMKVPMDLAKIPNSRSHMKAATKDLRDSILSGKFDKGIFNDTQLKQIISGKDKIKDFTWHHHQDTGRMQLIPTDIHDKTGHIGGMKLWFSK